MAPESPERSSPIGRRYCGMGNHMLREPHTRVSDRKVLHFGQKINSELRPDTPLCKTCYDKLEEIYKYKAYNAREHQRRKQAESQRQDVTNPSDNSSTTSTSVPRRLATATAAIRRPTPVPVIATLSEDNMPTTSAAASEKRKRSNPPPAPAVHAPESPERSSPIGRRYCGMGNHMLREPHTRVSDRKVLHFGQKINSELRPDTPLCKTCYDKLEEIYKYKAYNAREHQRRKQAESVSDVSSSQRQDVTNSSDNSSTTSTSVPRRLATATAAIRRPTPVPVIATLSEDNMPTTSAAAAVKRKRSNPPPAAQHVTQSSQSSYVSDDDDPNSNLS